MKKSFLTYLVLVTLFFTACNESHSGYEINGHLKGLASQEVILEFLSPTELVQIDTAMTDEEGKFSMKGNVQEKGFYRIVNGQKFWIFLLENKKMTLVADANDQTLKDLSISDYKAGEEFQSTINFLMQKQEEFKAESAKMQALMTNPEADGAAKAAAQSSFTTFQESIMDELRNKVSENIAEFPFSSVYLLSALNPQQDLEFIRTKVGELEKTIPKSVYLQNVKDMIQKIDEQTKQAPIPAPAQQVEEIEQTGKTSTTGGEKAKEIIMNNPEGKEMKLSDLRGKVVLIDFWASWCKPCRRENPNVVRMYHKYKDQGFDIFSVSLDKSMDKWKQAIAQDGLVWSSHVSDLKFWNNAASKAYGISSIPATLLIDKEGNIIARNLRGAALEAKLAEILK